MINTKALVALAQIIGEIYDNHTEQFSKIASINSFLDRINIEKNVSISINDSFMEKIKSRNDVKIISLKYFNEKGVAYSGNDALDIINEQNLISLAFFQQKHKFELNDIFSRVLMCLWDFDITID